MNELLQQWFQTEPEQFSSRNFPRRSLGDYCLQIDNCKTPLDLALVQAAVQSAIQDHGWDWAISYEQGFGYSVEITNNDLSIDVGVGCDHSSAVEALLKTYLLALEMARKKEAIAMIDKNQLQESQSICSILKSLDGARFEQALHNVSRSLTQVDSLLGSQVFLGGNRAASQFDTSQMRLALQKIEREKMRAVSLTHSLFDLSLDKAVEVCRRWISFGGGRTWDSLYACLASDSLQLIEGRLEWQVAYNVDWTNGTGRIIAAKSSSSIPTPCSGCANYHGKRYNGVQLVCGIYPSGCESDICPDWRH